MWLTNLDIPKRHQELTLTQKYDAELYPRYDNYDAINVSRVANIPMDYDGIVGICPDQCDSGGHFPCVFASRS